MDKVDRWLLPEGIEEMLPEEAQNVESLRRLLVDLFQHWGYDYVIPPMVEFTDSLITASNEDVELLTFKLTDQLSGKTMGIRADITTQVARMDAHSLVRTGVNRLCYAGHVMYTRPKSPLASRTPVQVGVELFGESGLAADIEVMSLLIESLQKAGCEQYLDIGHAGIYRALARAAELSKDQELELFDLLQVKSVNAIDDWVARNVQSSQVQAWLKALPRLSGNGSLLAKAAEIFAEAPVEVCRALEELSHIADILKTRYPSVNLYFDLSELRGYHYYTGIIFGAFAPGVGNAIAMGGRYDHIGEAFGRARPATGFAADLTAISRRMDQKGDSGPAGVFVAASEDVQVWEKVQALRESGERVVCGLDQQREPLKYQNCDRQLVLDNGQVVIRLLDKSKKR